MISNLVTYKNIEYFSYNVKNHRVENKRQPANVCEQGQMELIHQNFLY